MKRRIAERTFTGAAAALLVALACSAAVPAVAISASSDPPPGSPSGVIYRLPVDSGREDAAPRPDQDPSGGGLPGSTFRSDNNFGTSSNVPGDPRAGKNGAGSGSATAAGAASTIALANAAGDNGNPSAPLSFILLVGTVGVGAFLGVTGSRSLRRGGA